MDKVPMKSLDGINKLEAQLSHNRPKSEIDGGWKSKWWGEGVGGFLFVVVVCCVVGHDVIHIYIF
jgi:hypothetical protein